MMGKRGDREFAKLEQTVREHLAAGHQSFVVSVYCMADGMSLRKIAEMRGAGQQLLLNMGLDVTGINYDEWKYTAHYQVQVRQKQQPEKQCPKCAETIKAAAITCRYCGTDLSASAATDSNSLTSDIAAAVSLYRQWFHTGDLAAIWEHRNQLEERWLAEGPKTAQEYESFSAQLGDDFFWIDAFPAFAGLHMGFKAHNSPVIQYAGNADAHVDRGNKDQRAVMDAIDERAKNAF